MWHAALCTNISSAATRERGETPRVCHLYRSFYTSTRQASILFILFILFTVGAGRPPKPCYPPSVHPSLTSAFPLLRQSRHVQSPTPRFSPHAAQTRMVASAAHGRRAPNITFQLYLPGIRLLFVLQTVLLQENFIVISLICFSKCRVTRELRSVRERSQICARNLPSRTREINNSNVVHPSYQESRNLRCLLQVLRFLWSSLALIIAHSHLSASAHRLLTHLPRSMMVGLEKASTSAAPGTNRRIVVHLSASPRQT